VVALPRIDYGCPLDLIHKPKNLISSFFLIAAFTRLYHLVRDITSLVLQRHACFSFSFTRNFPSRLFLETTVTPQWLQSLHSNCHPLARSFSHAHSLTCPFSINFKLSIYKISRRLSMVMLHHFSSRRARFCGLRSTGVSCDCGFQS